MILQIIAYTITAAAALSVAAVCAERFAQLQGTPRRTAWIIVMALSVLLPMAMLLVSRPPTIQQAPVAATQHQDPVITSLEPIDPAVSSAEFAIAPARADVPAEPVSMETQPQSVTWRIPLPSDRLLIASWIVVSSLISMYLIGASILLRRRAEGWQRATVLDQDVLVSEVTGPALLGVFRPHIVVPRWLLQQPRATQALILEHEQQHLSTRDPLLVAAGWIVLAAVPWNLPLWWQWRRLRQAIELDCDARVLRAGAEVTTYAEVLLVVTQRATRMPVGALAMSEPVNAMERRIENLMPDDIRHAGLQRIAAVALAMLGAGGALALEPPPLPARSTSSVALPMPAVVGASSAAVSSALPVAAQTIVAAAPAPGATGTAPASQPQRVPSPTAFSVRLLPLHAFVWGNLDQALLDRVYSSLAANLRAVPGLTLVTPQSANDQRPVNYEVEMESDVLMTAGVQSAGFRIRTLSKPAPSILELEELQRAPLPDCAVRDYACRELRASCARILELRPRTEMRTDVRQDLMSGNSPLRRDMQQDMEKFVARIRVQDFPADPSLKATLLDRRLAFGVRQNALDVLLSLSRTCGEPDPEVVRGGIDLATTGVDPVLRSTIWKQLSNTGSPEILDSLVQALGAEKDDQVRLDLIAILSTGFRASPKVLLALATVARNGKQQIARMAAQRSPTGDGAWNDYLIATLKDSQLTDTQRLEPLAYLESLKSLNTHVPPLPGLDGESILILGNLLEKTQTFSPGVRGAALALAESSIPVAADIIVDILRPRESRSAAAREVRYAVLSHPGPKGKIDPRVRAVLEEVVARDSDPAARGAAKGRLQSEAIRLRDGW